MFCFFTKALEISAQIWHNIISVAFHEYVMNMAAAVKIKILEQDVFIYG